MIKVYICIFWSDDDGGPLKIVMNPPPPARARPVIIMNTHHHHHHHHHYLPPRLIRFYPAVQMVVGWYHSHPGFGCWLSGVDINTQQSFEQLNARAVSIVVDPIQSVKGKVRRRVFLQGGAVLCDYYLLCSLCLLLLALALPGWLAPTAVQYGTYSSTIRASLCCIPAFRSPVANGCCCSHACTLVADRSLVYPMHDICTSKKGFGRFAPAPAFIGNDPKALINV